MRPGFPVFRANKRSAAPCCNFRLALVYHTLFSGLAFRFFAGFDPLESFITQRRIAMPDTVPGKVFVVFHGLVVLVKRSGEPSFYTGYFVEMPNHEYLAGSWLNERPIPPVARLALNGVTAGQNEID